MKLTKQKLYRLIKEELLNEAAKGIQDIPEGYHVVCIKIDGGFQISLDSIEWEGGEEIGYIRFKKIPISKQGNCLGAMAISMARVMDLSLGWGPFLYDLVMEKATIEARGIVPDRSIVSDSAQDVWKYYLDNRMGDIHIRQLDDLNDSFKDGPRNDCSQNSSQNQMKRDWVRSPLSKIYSKPPTTIEALKKLEKLIGG